MSKIINIPLFFMLSLLFIHSAKGKGDDFILTLKVDEWNYSVDIEEGMIELQSSSGKSIRFQPAGISNIPMAVPIETESIGAIRGCQKNDISGDFNVKRNYDGSIVVLSNMPTGILYRVNFSRKHNDKIIYETIWVEKQQHTDQVRFGQSKTGKNLEKKDGDHNTSKDLTTENQPENGDEMIPEIPTLTEPGAR